MEKGNDDKYDKTKLGNMSNLKNNGSIPYISLIDLDEEVIQTGVSNLNSPTLSEENFSFSGIQLEIESEKPEIAEGKEFVWCQETYDKTLCNEDVISEGESATGSRQRSGPESVLCTLPANEKSGVDKNILQCSGEKVRKDPACYGTISDEAIWNDIVEDTVLEEDVEQSFQSFLNENVKFDFFKCDMIIDYSEGVGAKNSGIKEDPSMKTSQMSLLSHQFLSPKKTFEIEDMLGCSTEQPNGITNTNSLRSSKEDKYTKVLGKSVALQKIPLIAGPPESKLKQWKESLTKRKGNALGKI